MSVVGKRYLLGDQLGAGGMGTVYRAYDRMTGQSVALKRVTASVDQLQFGVNRPPGTSDSSDLTLSLAREFQTLASVRHPHIISVLDYGFDADQGAAQPYFTMDLLEDVQTIIEAGSNESPEVKLGLVIQVLQALAYLHRRGILHRDLKPANVMTIRYEHSLQVKLLDFGLSLDGDEDGQTAGTLGYMAPEVLMGNPTTEQADLYAIGVIAYELFAGRHPFDVDDVGKLVRQVIEDTPDFDAMDAAEDVALVIERLLAKIPEDRFKNASEVIEALCRASGQPLPIETAEIRDSFLQAARFVGRSAEMKQLEAALNHTMDGHGELWLIGGESGVGKSRLLDELRTRALIRGFVVARGQAVIEGSSPFELWHPLIRWLAIIGDPTDEEAGILKELVPEIEDIVGHEVAPPPDLDHQQAMARIHAVIAALIQRQAQPVMFILEDLQWAGKENFYILNRVTEYMRDLPMLIVGNFRDDEAPQLPLELPTAQLLKLNRLKEESIAALSASMLGEAGRQEHVVQLLQRETEGNVFFLIEVVRALAEEAGQLDRIGGMTLPQRVLAGGVERIVRRRLDRVPEWGHPLLQRAAVVGRLLDTDVLRAMSCGIDVDAWLTACANAAVFDVQDGRWRFAHDKLREGILNNLPENERTALYREVAESFEYVYGSQLDGVSPALSHYWRVAGDPLKEASYAARAGDVAFRTYAMGEALTYYNRAVGIARQINIGTEHIELIYQRRGRAFELGAQFDQALANYQELRELAAAYESDSLRLTSLKAEALLRSVPNPLFDVQIAEALIQEALELARRLEDRRSEAAVYWNLMLIENFRGNSLRAEAYGAQSITICRALNLREQLAYNLNDIQRSYLGTGRLEKAKQVLQEARELWREFNNLPMLVDNLSSSAYVHFLMGEHDEALVLAGEGNKVADSIGNQWGKLYSNWTAAYIHLERGEIDTAMAMMGRAVEVGDGNNLILGQLFGRAGLAMSHTIMGDYENAIRLVKEALSIAAANKIPGRFGHWITSLYAYILAHEGAITEAELYVRPLEKEIEQDDFGSPTLIFLYNALCKIALRKHENERLLQLAESYLRLLEDAGTFAFSMDGMYFMAQALKNLGRLEEAYQAVTEARLRAEKLNSVRIAVQILSLQAELEDLLGESQKAVTTRHQCVGVIHFILDNVSKPELKRTFLHMSEVRALTR